MKLIWISILSTMLCLQANAHPPATHSSPLFPSVVVEYIDEKFLYSITELLGGNAQGGRRYFLWTPQGDTREGLYFTFSPKLKSEDLPSCISIEVRPKGEIKLRHYELPWPIHPEAFKQELSVGLTDWPGPDMPLCWRICLKNESGKTLWSQESTGFSIETFIKRI